jgi:hypothetical protein
MSTPSSKNLINRDASLEDLWKQTILFLSFVKVHRKWLIILPTLFGTIGLGIGVLLDGEQKKAEYVIAAEEESSAGWEGLLAQFGLDVGGSNPAGVFQGESLVRLFQTRTLIERSLLQKIAYRGDSVLLANAVFAYTKHASKKEFEAVAFKQDRTKQDALADSALYLAYKYVRKEMLSVSKPDKKQSFINVSCVHADGELAIALGGVLIKTVTDYYVESLTKKARQNLNVLKLEADSVQSVLDENLGTTADLTDLNVNPLKQRLRVQQNRAMIDLQISVALYGELAKNLKLAEIGLRKQTPLIQIIESPRRPLETVGLKLWQYIVVGIVGGLALAAYLIRLQIARLKSQEA